jgi:predicted Zn finger-like uncharacterized protein
MFTICSRCQLTLVVTAADLRIGLGHVRCGRCSNVFNALASLTEERQPPLPAPKPAPAVASDSDDAVPEEELEFDAESTDVAELFIDPGTGVAEPIGTATLETIVLRGGDGSSDIQVRRAELPRPSFVLEESDAEGELTTQDEPEDEDEALLEHDPGAFEVIELQRQVQAPGPGTAAGSTDAAAPAAPEIPVEDLSWAAVEPAPETPGARRAYIVGCAIAALLLIAQIVHHYRAQLATHQALQGPLTSLYAALGMPITPDWDVSAYDVRQLGASAAASATGQLTVRASLMNVAPRAQPLPLLRVTVQDRFGNRVAARDVAPQEYAPPALAQRSFLAAGQRVDTEIRFVDPGDSVVGFEIDACLPGPAGALACGNEPAAR